VLGQVSKDRPRGFAAMPRRRRELRRDQAASTGSRPVRTLLGELVAVRPAGQSSGRGG